jgi:hypothetical protein
LRREQFNVTAPWRHMAPARDVFGWLLADRLEKRGRVAAAAKAGTIARDALRTTWLTRVDRLSAPRT